MRAIDWPEGAWKNALYVEHARFHFEVALTILQAQHQQDQPWDRYATMASKHWSIHESCSEDGDRRTATQLAIGGIWQAIRAEKEKSGAPGVSRSEVLQEHARFVGKQAASSTVALALAVTRPTKVDTLWDKLHRRIARKLLS